MSRVNAKLLRKEDIKVFHVAPGRYRFGTNMVTLGWCQVHLNLDGSKSYLVQGFEDEFFSSLDDVKNHFWGKHQESLERSK